MQTREEEKKKHKDTKIQRCKDEKKPTKVQRIEKETQMLRREKETQRYKYEKKKQRRKENNKKYKEKKNKIQRREKDANVDQINCWVGRQRIEVQSRRDKMDEYESGQKLGGGKMRVGGGKTEGWGKV